MTTDEALQVAGGMIVLIFISTVIQNHYGLGGFHHGMQVRIACCSLIYRKVKFWILTRFALLHGFPSPQVFF